MKKYTIRKTKHRMTGDPSITDVTETLEGLIKYFTGILEVGNSWNKKINMNPKTIKSFVINLQKSYEEQEAQCFNRTYVELINN